MSFSWLRGLFEALCGCPANPVTPASVQIADSSLADNSFHELNGTGVVEVVGDDEVGRRVIVVSACRLPANKDVHPDKLLRYVINYAHILNCE